MTEGSEAADQVVRMMLSGSEVTVKLAGSALKNGLAMLFALLKNHKRVYGKVNMTKLLRETRDIRTFQMTPAQFRQFRRRAGALKILYSAVQERNSPLAPVDVIMPVTEVERANMIFEKIKYVPEKEKQAVKEKDEKPKEEPERKKESRSERDSCATRDNSSTRSEKAKTTSERPSVLERLKGFAAEKQEAGVPTRTKTRSKAKGR